MRQLEEGDIIEYFVRDSQYVDLYLSNAKGELVYWPWHEKAYIYFQLQMKSECDVESILDLIIKLLGFTLEKKEKSESEHGIRTVFVLHKITA